MSRLRWEWRPLGVLVCAMAVMGGCATPRATTEPPAEEEAAEEEAVVIVHSAYEDFDPGPYQESAPESAALTHDVPSQLMAGRTSTGGSRSFEGFRIQLFQTQDPSQADQFMEEVSGWWENQKRAGATGRLFTGSSPPVYNVWRQPYYRIRIGDFASRDAADTALQSLSTRFAGAFVVPDRVTVRD